MSSAARLGWQGGRLERSSTSFSNATIIGSWEDRSTRRPERTHFQDLRLRGRERQPVETPERRSISHHLLRSKVGQRMPLIQRRDLEHRQRRTPGAPLTKAWIEASRASNAGPPNASIRSRNPPPSRSRLPSRLRKQVGKSHGETSANDPLGPSPRSTNFCRAFAICLSILRTELAFCQGACREKEVDALETFRA